LERPLRIAQVSPLFEPVPPKTYGGTERVVSYLTEALVALGHEVTLFASGDSVTSAKLVAACPASLRLGQPCDNALAPHLVMLEKVYRRAREFDILHFHVDFIHFPRTRALELPNVTTLHGRLDAPELPDLYAEFSKMPVVSISNAQREPLPHLNWQGTVLHGLPLDRFSFHAKPKPYLAFLGRISREKGVDQAVEIAAALGMPLRIAAKVDPRDAVYHSEVVRPLFARSPHVEFLGEIGDDRKDDFLGEATALLMPIDWPEPFGLVMIEAMACGTPVIAFRRGSVPEIIEDGVSGLICDGTAHAIARARRELPAMDRKKCRASFLRNFGSERMAADYVRIYRKVMKQAQLLPRESSFEALIPEASAKGFAAVE
jgi:glycosyltransferase involved in cell wall biosynthesis